jgi:hypothetical protein
MSGSSANVIAAGSLLPFVNGGNGTQPTPMLGFGFGSFTLNGTTAVTVADTGVDADSIIIPCLKTVAGTVGALPVVQTKTAGTGFTILGTASDTSVYDYLRIG